MEAQDHVDLNAGDAKSKPPKARRRTATKAQGDTGGKRSLNLRIDDDSYKRLSIHALMKKRTISELVMEYAQGLREFSMPARIGGGAARTEQGE